MPDPIVRTEGLRKVYEPYSRGMKLLLRTAVTEPVTALDDVSFDVYPGEMKAVLGPNGAGKSTLFRVLTGLTTPTSGSATVMGYDATTESHRVRRLVGFMPAENRTLLLRHSCRQNLAFHGSLQGIPSKELPGRIDETLEMVGLYEARERIGFALSSGMLARLMLARAILHEPAVLILDEPTGAVDPIGSFELLTLVQRIARDRNLAVLISSHRLDEVEMLNDEVLLLNRGKIVYTGGLSGMTGKARAPRFEVVFDTASTAVITADRLRGLEGLTDVAVDAETVVITTDRPLGDIVDLLDPHMEGVVSVGRGLPRLRDVLAELLGSGREDRSVDAD